jgi:tetratricopeptide (TPR) repeat protein
MGDRSKVPNLVLRRIREVERLETRAEFAEAILRKARELGESVAPTERYIAKLEDGEVRYPYPAYRRVLTELCGRPMAELGFIREQPNPAAALAMRRNVASAPAAEAARDHSQLLAAQEWPMWFGLKLANALALIANWNEPIAESGSLQALVHEEILMFDAAVPDRDEGAYAAHALGRRQALATLAALPMALVTANQLLATDAHSPDAGRDLFLSRCAASITACWHLLRGRDLPTIDQVLSGYLLPLEALARQRSKYQRAAAALASQAHRISGTTALHRHRLSVRERHCKQAVHYAGIACDPHIMASALISLASTYFYMSDPGQAVDIYEQAFALEASMSALQRSRLYAELAVVYGQFGRAREAVLSADLAEEIYPDQPEGDPSFLYAEFTPASLTLEKGLAYVALAERLPTRGYQGRAANIFARVNDDDSMTVPDRIRYEIANNQARTAVLLDDLDAFETYLRHGIEGAVFLGSRQRHQEAMGAWRHAIAKWPNERRVKDFSGQLQLRLFENRSRGLA